MLRLLALATLVSGSCLVAAACGGDDPVSEGARSGTSEPGHWKHCRLEGPAQPGGLTIFGGDLIAVAGGGDRAVYTWPAADLVHGGVVRARKLEVDVRPEAALLGGERFAQRGYRMKHLWALPLDFQGVAVQAPDLIYVGDRSRRVVYWGRLIQDAAGRLTQVRLTGLSVAPGAERSKLQQGDWRDQGPGLAGLLALSGRRRMEDLYVLDRAAGPDGTLRVRRMDRYGSALGSIPVRHSLDAEPACNAISWDGTRYVIHYGAGRGRLATMREPEAMRSAKLSAGAPGPAVEGVGAWTGMTHGEDGTVYLVSGGDPVVVAWRAP